MKMKHSIFAGFAALALWACQTSLIEPVPETPEQPEVPEVPEVPSFKVLTIEAGAPGQTKTSYKDDEYFSWSLSDQVSVLCNHDDWIPFTLVDSPASSCRFKSPLVPSDYEMGSSTGAKMALYPASQYHVYTSDTGVSYHLPAERDFRAAYGGHEESAIPMFAYGNENDAYLFANLTGAVKFTFTGVPVPEVKFVFTSAGDKKMNGVIPLTGLETGSSALAISVTWAPEGATDEADKTLTFYADVDPSAQTVSFYVPYVGTLPAGSRVQLLDADGATAIFDRTTVKDIEVVKNHITVVDDLDVSPSGDEHTSTPAPFSHDVPNPERGFTTPNVLDYNGSAFPSSLYSFDDDNSLVFIRFDLTGYRTNKNLDPRVITAIGGVFNQVRNLGKKAVIRFIYGGENEDATLDVVKSHISKLKDPVFYEYEDVIYLIQAGFIGDCGEWIRSKYFKFSYPPGLTDEVSGFEDHATVIDDLLTAVPESRQIALRSAYYKRYYTKTKGITASCWDWNPITTFGGTDYNSRIAFHNDAFGHDGGTFRDFGALGDGNDPKNVDRRMWYPQSAYLACGGETYSSAPHSLFSKWPRVLNDLFDQHISYLGNYRYSSCLRDLTDDQIEELRKYMGYRLLIEEAKVYYSDSDPDALAAGKPLTVSCQLKNEGAAPVIYQRPMKLVLLREGSATELVSNLGDVRKVASDGGTRSFFAKFDIPSGGIQPGDRLAIWLPDASATIAGRAVYAIRLANAEDEDFQWVAVPDPSDPTNPALAIGGYNVFYTFP